jgi:hypothetical protein
VTWEDVTRNSQAWSIFIWFATLVTLAEVGVVRRVADQIQAPVARVASFATVSGHATTLLPIFLYIATGPRKSTPARRASGSASLAPYPP